jgi:hypothetical protein
MGMASVIIGVFFLLSIVLNIAKGRIRGRNGYVDRSTSPVSFWLILALKCVVLLFLMFPRQSMSIIQFGIEDTSAETRRKAEEFRQGHESQAPPQQ